MNSLTIGQFTKNPMQPIVDAVEGSYSKVMLGNGHNAVIIDESEFTMLNQALNLCMEHPEWTRKSESKKDFVLTVEYRSFL